MAPAASKPAASAPAGRASGNIDLLRLPSGLYNGMVHPLIPYRIAGVIWYQGESNIGQAERYRKLFCALIRDWRQQWGQGDFPFLFVQLPNFGERRGIPVASRWAELRETQTAALKLPNTGMVVTIDIGEADDIHPKNKQEVGLRLALLADTIVYGKRVTCSGPVYDSMKIEGDSVRIRFQSVGGLLGARENQPLKGFAIAGEDRKFYWADARIDKHAVVARSDQVPQPVAVRYAWADNPECNLIGMFGLPAAPFRTDDWPIGGKKGN